MKVEAVEMIIKQSFTVGLLYLLDFTHTDQVFSISTCVHGEEKEVKAEVTVNFFQYRFLQKIGELLQRPWTDAYCQLKCSLGKWSFR